MIMVDRAIMVKLLARNQRTTFMCHCSTFLCLTEFTPDWRRPIITGTVPKCIQQSSENTRQCLQTNQRAETNDPDDRKGHPGKPL